MIPEKAILNFAEGVRTSLKEGHRPRFVEAEETAAGTLVGALDANYSVLAAIVVVNSEIPLREIEKAFGLVMAMVISFRRALEQQA